MHEDLSSDHRLPGCFSDSAKRIRIDTIEDIRRRLLRIYSEKINLRASRSRKKALVNTYLSKLDKLYESIASSIGRCARLPPLDAVHPFYREIINIATKQKYEDTVRGCRRAIYIITGIMRDYRKKIAKTEDPKEARRYIREFIGRTLSILKRKVRGLELLKESIKEVGRSPCIEEDLVKIVVAGMPQVGKSTLIARISSAKPEISPFPFTTKKVIVGHGELDGYRYMAIDTPGILDREISEMNEIELKAVSALKHLSDRVVFMIDPRKSSYYSLDQQMRVLASVENVLGIERGKIYVAINKIDIASREEIHAAIDAVQRHGYDRYVLISAKHGTGVNDLLKRVIGIQIN